MTKLVLDKINSGASLSIINDNFQKIEDELQNKVMYRSNPLGEPNSFSSDVDMNSKRVFNLPVPILPNEAARLQDVLAGQDYSSLRSYLSDSVAAAGGVLIGGLYRNGSIVMVRVA